MNGGSSMTSSYFNTKIKFLHGFSNKTRLQILECIQHEEKTVSQIVEQTNGSQSNISQHLACLKDCGLIVGRQEGKFIYYSLSNDQIRKLLSMFDTVLVDIEQQIASCQTKLDVRDSNEAFNLREQ